MCHFWWGQASPPTCWSPHTTSGTWRLVIWAGLNWWGLCLQGHITEVACSLAIVTKFVMWQQHCHVLTRVWRDWFIIPDLHIIKTRVKQDVVEQLPNQLQMIVWIALPLHLLWYHVFLWYKHCGNPRQLTKKVKCHVIVPCFCFLPTVSSCYTQGCSLHWDEFSRRHCREILWKVDSFIMANKPTTFFICPHVLDLLFVVLIKNWLWKHP